MRSLYLLLFTIFFSVSLHAQTDTSAVKEENYDSLKGGYTILLRTDDSLQYLFLKKGNKIICELNANSKEMLIQNLGFVEADFTNYFVLVQAYGSGNPHYIQLIRKETGKNLLKPGAAWIDADEKKEYLLYSDVGTPKKKDKMILLNVRTGVKQYFNFPEDLFEDPGMLYRIESSIITEKKLVIKYSTQQGEKTKTYNR